MNYNGSQTSEYKHSEQCTILDDFQAKKLQNIYISQILILSLFEN